MLRGSQTRSRYPGAAGAFDDGPVSAQRTPITEFPAADALGGTERKEIWSV